MRLRSMPLLLAPFVLLIALSLLGACTPTPKDFGGGSGGGGFATAPAVSTVQAAGTSVIGSISNGTVPPFATPEPPTAIPTIPSASLSVTELKYRILDQYPDFFFCDPDYYPVARGDEGDVARQRFPELQADAAEFNAILAHNGLAGQTSFSDDQKLLIYRDHKKLAALHFQLAGSAYQFQFLTGGQGQQGSSIQGTIDGSGKITIQKQTPAFATCPICLAVHTRIDTPNGAVLVEDIRLGDVVWTLNASGARVAAPVLKVARVPVSVGHILIHLKLDDGRELWASPGHPTSDGRILAELQRGDVLDGAHVTLAEQIEYSGGATFDLLPEGGTGFYWANGILMGSTLHP